MAAIEFCRERILEVPLDEFEDWFKDRHPESFKPRIVSATSSPDLKKNAKSIK
jgi:hypothetical protein